MKIQISNKDYDFKNLGEGVKKIISEDNKIIGFSKICKEGIKIYDSKGNYFHLLKACKNHREQIINILLTSKNS